MIPELKLELLEWFDGFLIIFFLSKDVLPDGSTERLSVNHVDNDGNIALHYCAANGLVECVEHLVRLNSILSLVNKSQMTCCEMADEVRIIIACLLFDHE